jgi:glutathione S-transferase
MAAGSVSMALARHGPGSFVCKHICHIVEAYCAEQPWRPRAPPRRDRDRKRRPKGREQAATLKDPAIRLHLFPDPWGLNPSPFCLKVETYCRLAGIPFEAVRAFPVFAPRGKLPVLSHGAERVPDSHLIIDWLKKRHGDVLDRDLDAGQRALGHLISRVCEESLYFAILYIRWVDLEGWRVVKPALFQTLIPLARDAVAAIARRGVLRALRGQGYGRYGPEEIAAAGAADLSAIATILGTRDFAVADRPTSYDATLYAFLANILLAPLENGLKDVARGHANLVAYVARVRGTLGPG